MVAGGNSSIDCRLSIHNVKSLKSMVEHLEIRIKETFRNSNSGPGDPTVSSLLVFTEQAYM